MPPFQASAHTSDKDLMPTERQLQDIGILNKGLELLRIGLFLSPRGPMQYALRCRCLRHEDGSLAAIWPQASRRPQLLRFLPALTKKERRKLRLIRTAISLNLPSLGGFETLTLFTSQRVLRKLRHYPDWTIYIGRPGRERRMLIWHRDLAGNTGITKISLSIQAARSVYRERLALRQPVPEGMAVPRLIEHRGLAFTQEDLPEMESLPEPHEASELPPDAVRQWLSCSLHTEPLGLAVWYREAQHWLEARRPFPQEVVSDILLQKMRVLFDCMAPDAPVPVARAHGDFTPRHLRICEDKLLVAGWRSSQEDLPAMYDWFHFIYHTRTLLDQKPFAAIRREIDEMLDEPEWEAFLLEHDIDPGEAEQQYLLCAVSRYLQQSPAQDDAGRAMLQTWCEALGFWMDYEGLLTQRQIVLQDIIHFLHDRPYAALKLAEPDITALPLSASLELCMDQESAAALRRYLKQHRCVERMREHRQSEGRKLSIFLSSGASIHIRCITRLRYGSLMFGDMQRLLALAYTNEAGVRRVPLCTDLQYRQLTRALRREEVVPPTACKFSERGEGPLFSLRNPVPGALPSLRKVLKRTPANRGFRGLMHRLQYGFDLLMSLTPRRGFIITFSGVDDAGQRMVIEATRHRIRQELQAPVIVLPHHPRLASVLALARRRTQRAAAGRSMNPSLAEESLRGTWTTKLLRRAEDLLVQAYVLFRYVLRGYVVLYDHYFDCRESENSQVRLPGVLTGWWYRFLVKPDLNFLLYAPAEVIRQRSQELSTEDIERLTGEYLALFNKLERRSGHGDFIPVRNTRLGDTLETLFRHIHTRQVGI